MFALVQLVQDYLQERQRIEAAGESVLALIRAPAARAAFTLDPELGVTVVQTALEVPFVVRAELDDNLGRMLAEAARERGSIAAALADRPAVRRASDLPRERRPPRCQPARRSRSRRARWACWRSSSIPGVLAQNFLARSWLLLVTGMARTLVLGLVLAIVTHLMVTRPLAQLVDAVEYVDPEAPERAGISRRRVARARRAGPSAERPEPAHRRDSAMP